MKITTLENGIRMHKRMQRNTAELKTGRRKKKEK